MHSPLGGTGIGVTRPRSADGGFTLIEMVVAVALAAFLFLALAGGLAATLRTVSISKGRTQGNEVATEAIEELQRLDFKYLGVCGPFPSPQPSGFPPANAVVLTNCPSGAPSSSATQAVQQAYQDQFGNPCKTSTGSELDRVPAMSYTCRRNNIAFSVRRFIAWDDPTAQVTKKLAVIVSWVDQGGRHEVSQQSSLRAPNEATIFGQPPPAFVSLTVNPTNVMLNANGTLQGDVTLNASVTGLADTSSDRVFISVATVRDEGSGDVPVTSVIDLAAAGSADFWAGTIPANDTRFRFGSGSQYLTFTANRADDGKGSSRVATQVIKLCAGTFDGSGNCSVSSSLPSISVQSQPSTVDIDPAGVMVDASFVVTARTNRITADAPVTLTVFTQTGAYTVNMVNTSCSGDQCDWRADVRRENALRFPAGVQRFYLTAAQNAAPFSTAAVATGDVNFQ